VICPSKWLQFEGSKGSRCTQVLLHIENKLGKDGKFVYEIFVFLNGNYVLFKQIGWGVGDGVGLWDNYRGCNDSFFAIYELLYTNLTAPTNNICKRIILSTIKYTLITSLVNLVNFNFSHT